MTPEQIQIALLLIQILTLIALVAYVIKTAEMASAARKSTEIAEKTLREMREQRDAEIAPYVVVYLDAQGEINGLLYLVIKNTGKTVAKNVKINFEPPLPTRYPDLLQKVLPANGIPSIPPGYEIRTTVDSFVANKQSNPMAFTVKVTYYGGIIDKLREDIYYLDLTLFRGIVTSLDTTPTKIETALQNIKSSSEKLVMELQNISHAISQNHAANKYISREPVKRKHVS
ncbi:MAG: hypothetical protein M1282_09910 [Chloroflexi bacterium]|nr:hypothetical protein [Chloroflexota bacterium]